MWSFIVKLIVTSLQCHATILSFHTSEQARYAVVQLPRFYCVFSLSHHHTDLTP